MRKEDREAGGGRGARGEIKEKTGKKKRKAITRIENFLFEQK